MSHILSPCFNSYPTYPCYNSYPTVLPSNQVLHPLTSLPYAAAPIHPSTFQANLVTTAYYYTNASCSTIPTYPPYVAAPIHHSTFQANPVNLAYYPTISSYPTAPSAIPSLAGRINGLDEVAQHLHTEKLQLEKRLHAICLLSQAAQSISSCIAQPTNAPPSSSPQLTSTPVQESKLQVGTTARNPQTSQILQKKSLSPYHIPEAKNSLATHAESSADRSLSASDTLQQKGHNKPVVNLRQLVKKIKKLSFEQYKEVSGKRIESLKYRWGIHRSSILNSKRRTLTFEEVADLSRHDRKSIKWTKEDDIALISWVVSQLLAQSSIGSTKKTELSPAPRGQKRPIFVDLTMEELPPQRKKKKKPSPESTPNNANQSSSSSSLAKTEEPLEDNINSTPTSSDIPQNQEIKISPNAFYDLADEISSKEVASVRAANNHSSTTNLHSETLSSGDNRFLGAFKDSGSDPVFSFSFSPEE